MKNLLEADKKTEEDAPITYKWIYYMFNNPLSMWYTVYMIASFIGLFKYPIYCIHLIEIVVRSPILINVLRAVTLHGSSLLMTVSIYIESKTNIYRLLWL